MPTRRSPIKMTALAATCVAAFWMGVLACADVEPSDSNPATDPEIRSLVAQLEGKHCRYSGDFHEVCVKRPRATSWFTSLFARGVGGGNARCVTGAARCLESRGPDAADAVPALIHVLLDGPNDYDTGDGVIPARSTVASALGAIGDPRAIVPLAAALERAAPADRGPGALASSEPAAREAIIRALSAFGPAAGDHWAPIAAVLDERNADAAFIDAQHTQFDREAATDAVIDSIQRASGASSFTVPNAAVDRAIAALDHTTPAYLRKLEERITDRLATEAAIALGALGRAEAIPALERALANPAAAAAAAGALAQLGTDSPSILTSAVAALRAVWSSNAHGPRARGAAARALAVARDTPSLPLIAGGLSNPDTCEPCAAALTDFGPAARDAVDALRAVLAAPTLVERDAARVTYSSDASRQVACKRECVRALAHIDTPDARAALGAFVDDPDIGRDARRAIR